MLSNASIDVAFHDTYNNLDLEIYMLYVLIIITIIINYNIYFNIFKIINIIYNIIYKGTNKCNRILLLLVIKVYNNIYKKYKDIGRDSFKIINRSNNINKNYTSIKDRYYSIENNKDNNKGLVLEEDLDKRFKSYSINIDKVVGLYKPIYNRYNNKELDIKEYIEQFFVGLLEGEGTITVDYISENKKRVRFIIALKNLIENQEMIDLIVKYVGGRKAIERNKRYVTWYGTSRTDIAKILSILAKYPLLTTTKICQLDFAKEFINTFEYITKDKFKILRNNKYKKQEYLINHFNANYNYNNTYYFSGWLSGFIEAKGHFKLIKNLNTNAIINSQFIIGQNKDVYILKAILNYFNEKDKNISSIFSKSNVYYYKIYLSNKNFRYLLFKHFYKYPLLGYKYSQYKWWKINH